jgi:hypothetical protein
MRMIEVVKFGEITKSLVKKKYVYSSYILSFIHFSFFFLLFHRSVLGERRLKHGWVVDLLGMLGMLYFGFVISI